MCEFKTPTLTEEDTQFIIKNYLKVLSLLSKEINPKYQVLEKTSIDEGYKKLIELKIIDETPT